jgi:S-adenosylmethionine hydrolase
MSVVTLLSDFGLTDGYVAEVKAVLTSALPTVQMIDISHDVPAGDIAAGQYLINRSWHRFPAGTVHLVVVDPGVGTTRRAIAVEMESHRFVGPDNGVLTPMLLKGKVVALAISPTASPTFHGRDVFAPAAAKLAAGGRLGDLGPEIRDPVQFDLPQPSRNGREATGSVIYIDRFGTLISNIPGQWADGEGVVQVKRRALAPLKNTFGDVAPGALVAFVGSGGMIEVAVRDGSAAAKLKVGIGAEIRILPGDG